MDNAKKKPLHKSTKKKIFHDWQTTYHVTQQFMFVKAKINERKTNKKSNMMNYYVLCICIKLFFESWTKKSFTCSYCNCNSMAVNDVFQIAPFFLLINYDKKKYWKVILYRVVLFARTFTKKYCTKKILKKKLWNDFPSPVPSSTSYRLFPRLLPPSIQLLYPAWFKYFPY